MSIYSKISAEYNLMKTTTYEPSVNPKLTDSEQQSTKVTSNTVNTPMSSSLIFAVSRTATTIGRTSPPPNDTIQPVETNDDPIRVPPGWKRIEESPPTVTPPPVAPTPVTPTPVTPPPVVPKQPVQSNIKNVYGASIDVENAKSILGINGYNYIKTDQPGFTISTFTEKDIIVGGSGAIGGVGDIDVNGAIRLSGANRDLTAQAIYNYKSPKNVYGAQIDLDNARNILGNMGYNFIQTDSLGFHMPAFFTTNDIILGGPGTVGGIGDINLNGAIRLAGADRDETANLVRNFAVSKNVYGASVDLENAKNILGDIEYNYIRTDLSGFRMPITFTSNDIILGGTGTAGGIGSMNLNGAVRLAGINRDLTAQAISNYISPKNVYGCKVDIDNAKNILGNLGYNYIQTDLPGFIKPSFFTSSDIILGGTGAEGGIADTNLNGAIRIAGSNRDETASLVRNFSISKNVYGAAVDIANAKNILGTTGYNYIQTDLAGFRKPLVFTSNDIILGGAEAAGGISYVKLNGAVRLAGANRDLTAQAINNFYSPKNVYGAKVDLDNAKNIFGNIGYNYIQTDLPGFIKPATFTSNDIILGGTGTIGGISDVNLNGAIRVAGANRDETVNMINNYAISKNVYGAAVDIENAKSILGNIGYNYIQTDLSGFRMPAFFTSNDLILGGPGATGGIGNVNLNGAIRIAGANRDETANLIRQYVGIKPVDSNPASEDIILNESWAVVTGNNVNVRSGPDTSFSVLGQVNSGEVIKVAYKQGDWYHTYWGDHGGWINASYLKATSESTETSSGAGSVAIDNSTNLSIGSEGDAVTKLQTNLRWLGYFKGSIDGKFGTITQQAVMDLQSDYGLKETGIVDQRTKRALSKALYESGITDAMSVTGSSYDYLKFGDSGKAVEQLQSDLIYLKYYVGDIDGDFKTLTYNAVKAFQKDYGLEITGVVDEKTREKIKSEIEIRKHGNTSPNYEKDNLKERLISIVNKTPGFNLNKSMGYDEVVKTFLNWYTEEHRGQYLEGTYMALPDSYKMKALNHWADMINRGYSQVEIYSNLLPEDYYRSIPDVPTADSSLGTITSENKYDSKAAYDYYVKYYYPIDAFNEVNYKNFANSPNEQKTMIMSHFKPWARLVYGSSQSEKGQEFGVGIFYGLTISPLKTAVDCVEGLHDLTIGGGYKKLPGMVGFLAKAAVRGDYNQALCSMINQAVELWGTYNNAKPFEKGRMIGDLIGQTLLTAAGTVDTAEGIKNFVKSGGFKTAFKGVSEAVGRLSTVADGFLNYVKDSIIDLGDKIGYSPALAGDGVFYYISKSEISDINKLENTARAAGRLDDAACEIAKDTSRAISMTERIAECDKVIHNTSLKVSHTASETHADILRKELYAANITPPPYGNSCHHIVAWDAEKANVSREILTKYGVDVDSASNGVLLPYEKNAYVTTEAMHNGGHSADYYLQVENRLKEADKFIVSKNLSVNDGKMIISETLNNIRKDLLNGILKVHN